VTSLGTHEENTPRTVSAAEQLRDASVDYENSPVMRGLFRLKKSAIHSPYIHGIDVDVRRGYYAFDCSGMVDWLLQRTCPVASQSLRAGHATRPLARDFVETIAQLAPGQSRGGWLRVSRVSEARPGDVIAWLRPKFIKSENTGHVAVIILPPEQRSPFDSAYLVRVADSSRLHHQDDIRLGGANGFGFGTILVESNPASGAPSGFSFAGERAKHAWGTKVVIGRPLR
jgi:hypothetical protein